MGSPNWLEPRTYALVVAGTLAVVLVSVLSMVPVPFALMSPGPVENVLSGKGKAALIEISGHSTYPTTGTLDLLTVSVRGGPGQAATSWDLLQAWADPDVDARPVREVFPPDLSREQVNDANTAEMVTSQEAATAAALTELSIPYSTTLAVGGFADKAPAATELTQGDALLAVDGTPVTDLARLRDLLAPLPAGATVQVTVRRDGKEVVVPVTTMASDDGSGQQRTILGVIPAREHTFPFSVKFDIENIGGPSAGMMFALGIVDKLTPGPITGGQKIAGTGSVDDSGAIGAIGGIRQKLVAAHDVGAGWFLAPAGNCNEVVGHVPTGLRVVRVATLHEARTAVETIGSGTQAARDALPTCAGD